VLTNKQDGRDSHAQHAGNFREVRATEV